MARAKGIKPMAQNKKAFHDYLIIEKFNAGLVLTGTEIKSIRRGAINLKDGFAKIEENEAWLYNVHINPYEQGNRYNPDPARKRKLLLNKNEILKMLGKVKKEKYTIVPLSVFLENGWAKCEIALAKGKQLHDKRESIAKKTMDREIARNIKIR